MRPNSAQNHPLDCGQLIENLFFYGNTIVHIGRDEIPTLFKLADVDVLEQLLRLSYLNVFFNNSHVAIMGSDVRSVECMSLVDLDIEKELYQETLKHSNDEIKSKKFAKKISRLIKPYELPQGFDKIMNEQLKDDDFRSKILSATISHYQPNINIDEIKFELEYLNDTQFKVHTNFQNSERVGRDSPILALLTACEDLQVMSEFNSEISLPEVNSKMIQAKTNLLLKKTLKSKEEIHAFSHTAYDEAWALREAINQKKIHVKAIIKTLEKAEKYKGWLRDLPDDANLMREYMEKVEEKSILEELPFKAARFFIFNGLGAILSYLNPEVGIPLTVGANAFDEFLFEKLGEKWKPNQFIEGELRPLVKGTRKS
jgi:hypothetical protein